jgi:hypothetical protein
MNKLILTLMATASLTMTVLTAQAAPIPSYTLTDLGANTSGKSIDAVGDVAGSWRGANGSSVSHAFVYRRGKLIDLGALYDPTLQTCAYFTNILGDVLLTYTLPVNTVEYPVLYRNGRFTPLPFPAPGFFFAGLNDFGQIAGSYTAGVYHAFLIQPNGTVITLPSYGPVYGTFGLIVAMGITEGGYVYGYVDTGSPTQVPGTSYNTSDIAVITSAYGPPVNLGYVFAFVSIAVNNVGHFVDLGQVVNTSPLPSFLPVLHVGGKITNLGPVPGTETLCETYFIMGMNDFDTVVGVMADVGITNTRRPFLYVNGRMYDPNTLISPASSVHIDQLLGVNDLGQILAVGSDFITQQAHTWILNPGN